MKLPLENIYFFPTLTFERRSRKEFETVLSHIFNVCDNRGDLVIQLLEKNVTAHFRKEIAEMLKDTELDKGDIEALTISSDSEEKSK